MTDIGIELDDSNTSRLLKSLVIEAKKDQEITDDERMLVKEIEKLLWDIENDVELLMDDKHPNLFGELQDMLLDVLEKARIVANKDGKITKDEENLLNVIGGFVSTEGVLDLLDQFVAMFSEE